MIDAAFGLTTLVVGQVDNPMSLGFPKLVHDVGRTPWSAADAHVGLLVRTSMISLAEEQVLGDPRGPGGPPHFLSDKSQHWENYVALG
jgi:hypothetical protein